MMKSVEVKGERDIPNSRGQKEVVLKISSLIFFVL